MGILIVPNPVLRFSIFFFSQTLYMYAIICHICLHWRGFGGHGVSGFCMVFSDLQSSFALRRATNSLSRVPEQEALAAGVCGTMVHSPPPASDDQLPDMRVIRMCHDVPTHVHLS